FVPAVAWAQPARAPGYRIDVEADSAAWWDAVYADQPIITQTDDGASDPASGGGSASCSLSAPGIVTTFLDLLNPFDGDGVLEIGTGTGWTAALLASIGGVEVTTLEIDPRLAEQATANLQAAGIDAAQRVTVVTSDGAAGWPAGARFDGVHV